MQTLTLIRNMEEICEKLKVDDLIDFLAPIVDHKSNFGIDDAKKSTFSSLLFQSRESYHAFTSNDEITKIILSLGFDQIYSHDNLTKMITRINIAGDANNIISDRNAYLLFLDFTTALRGIKKLLYSLNKLIVEEKFTPLNKDQKILELEIIDYDHSGISIDRIKIILSSIQKLHDTIASLIKEEGAQLSIVYFDSGSDLLVGIKSKVKIVEKLANLLSQFWKIVRFQSYDDFNKKVESLEKGLEILQLINEKEKAGVLKPEDSSRFRHLIISDVTNLIENGAIIKEKEEFEHIDQRKLLTERRDIKLLHGKNPQNQSNENNKNEHEN